MRLPLVLALLPLVAACGREGNFPEMHEVEPNDDALHATAIANGDEWMLHGTCRDGVDRDYFKVQAGSGMFESTLSWTDGAFELRFDSGIDGEAPAQSAVSPIRFEATIDAVGQTSLVFAVDCMEGGNSIPAGLQYDLLVRIPQ